MTNGASDSGRVPGFGDSLLRHLRLAIYQAFAAHGQAPEPLELCARFDLSPDALWRALRHLEEKWSAIVLLPDSSYLWMAEPFSAVSTFFPARSGARRWFGNCIWDALSILALLKLDGVVETESPLDRAALRFEVQDGQLLPVEARIHFAVKASDWWRSIGFT